MLVTPHTLSLLVTKRCTAACDHCCFTCNPHRTESIPIPNLYKYIEQATIFPTMRVVVFTGGECFLLGKDLDGLVKWANGFGFITRFVSNGYWASSRITAVRRLQKLKDAGLKEANFSTGDCHSEYVNPAYVRNGAMAAVDLGITSVIACEVFKGSKFDLNEFLADPEFSGLVDSGKIILRLSPWMKFEGARKLDQTDTYMNVMRDDRVAGGACSTALKVLAITAEEDLIACCGLTMDYIPEVHLGSLKDETIGQIVGRLPDDFIKIWIHLYGPDAVIRYAQKLDPTIERPRDMAHICDVCRYMYNHEKIKKLVSENPPPNMHLILEQYYQSLMVPTPNAEHQHAIVSQGISNTNKALREMHRMAVGQPEKALAV